MFWVLSAYSAGTPLLLWLSGMCETCGGASPSLPLPWLQHNRQINMLPTSFLVRMFCYKLAYSPVSWLPRHFPLSFKSQGPRQSFTVFVDRHPQALMTVPQNHPAVPCTALPRAS